MDLRYSLDINRHKRSVSISKNSSSPKVVHFCEKNISKNLKRKDQLLYNDVIESESGMFLISPATREKLEWTKVRAMSLQNLKSWLSSISSSSPSMQCIFEIVRNMVFTIPLESVPRKEAPAPTQSPLFVRPISTRQRQTSLSTSYNPQTHPTDDNQQNAWKKTLPDTKTPMSLIKH